MKSASFSYSTSNKNNSPVTNAQLNNILRQSNDMSLADNITHRINELGKTLNAVARASSVSQSVLYQVTKGSTRQPSRDNLEKLARYFKCTVDELFLPVDKIRDLERNSLSIQSFVEDFKRLPADEQRELRLYVISRLGILGAEEAAAEKARPNLRIATPKKPTT